MKEVSVSEVVLDFALYPRRQIDSFHVGEMVAAVEGGATLPPIVIDKKSRRMVDGFHRLRVAERQQAATIMAVEKVYKNDQQMFIDAMRFNATHGRNLTSYDRAHAVILAGNLGISDALVADALVMTTERVSELRVNKAATVGSGKLARAVPIKRTISHMAGRKLSKEQAVVNRKLGGMNALFYVRQLIMLIESKLLDRENEKLMEELKKLQDAVDTVV